MSEKHKQIVREVNDAFTNARPEDFLRHCTENIRWNIVGEKILNGKQAVRDLMDQVKDCPPPQFDVKDLVAENDLAVCHGNMTMPDENGAPQPYSYCDIYRFDNDQVTELTSYIMKETKENTDARN